MAKADLGKTESQWINYIDFLKKEERGCCDHLCNLKRKNLDDDKLCMREHTKTILKEVDTVRGPIEKFTIGVIADTFGSPLSPYSYYYYDEWTLPDVKQLWNDFFKPDGYDSLIVLYRFKAEAIEFPRTEALLYQRLSGYMEGEFTSTEEESRSTKGISKWYNPSYFARSFEASLVHYFKSKKDSRLDTSLRFNFQDDLPRSLCYAVYVAIKLKSADEVPVSVKELSSPAEDRSETDIGFAKLQNLREMKALQGTSIDDLIKSEVLPTQQQLDCLQRKFLSTRSPEISEDLKHIGNLISKYLKKQFSGILSYSWLAYKPDKEGKPKVLVVLEKFQDKDATFKNVGYDFQVFEAGKFIAEADEAQKKMLEYDILKLENDSELMNCIRNHRVALKKRHSQIAIIEPSPIRSKGFQQNKHKCVEERCIAVYVRRKGYIPIGEEALSTSIDGISVDVLEGSVILCAAEIGRKIGTGSISGTLGGFIEHPLHGLCGITAAHVLLNPKEMETLIKDGKIAKKYFDENCISVYMYTGKTDKIEIGEVVEALYNCGDENVTGMEVAIFQLQHEIPEHGIIWNASTKMAENKTFDTGKILKKDIVDAETRLVKFGAKTGKTNGILRRRLMNVYPEKIPDLSLFDVLLIKGATGDKFSKKGDSGALVMAEGNEHYMAVGVLGGAIKCGEYIGTYVMPIQSVMYTLGISSLKSFTEDQMLISFKRMETKLEDVSKTLKDHLQHHTTLENSP